MSPSRRIQSTPYHRIYFKSISLPIYTYPFRIVPNLHITLPNIIFLTTYTAANCHGLEVYLYKTNTHMHGFNTYVPWKITSDVTGLRKTPTQKFVWELQQRHSRSTLLASLRDTTARNLQANLIVPLEENSLSSYYRKDSIEIGRDNGVLDVK